MTVYVVLGTRDFLLHLDERQTISYFSHCFSLTLKWAPRFSPEL